MKLSTINVVLRKFGIVLVVSYDDRLERQLNKKGEERKPVVLYLQTWKNYQKKCAKSKT
jgi:hypothetical protein